MKAKIIKSDSKGITAQVKIPLSGNMLSMEEAIQQAINQARLLANQYVQSQLDADESSQSVEEKKGD